MAKAWSRIAIRSCALFADRLAPASGYGHQIVCMADKSNIRFYAA
ncbi:hypothetical protein EDE15_2923 [Edaphobacter aggregans]|uniref:Uncharacterized protein n=1 Tax=Edaphobacter aggregans TaxID=570835 RepID=A0A428MK99_9BACT|nr:hypothetical protein EDE15_2923 [Edaphobacter aggregans]